jgi:hypothetical protein
VRLEGLAREGGGFLRFEQAHRMRARGHSRPVSTVKQ